MLIKGTASLEVKNSERNRELENFASLEPRVCEVLLYNETIKTLRKKVKCTFRPGDMEPLDIEQPDISEFYTLTTHFFNRQGASKKKVNEGY